MKRILGSCTLCVLLAFPAAAQAGWCYGNFAAPFEEAYENATLIFYGSPIESTWAPEPMSVTFDNGYKSRLWDGASKPAGTPFDVNKDWAARYLTRFKVKHVWKDTNHRVAKDEIVVQSGTEIRFGSGDAYVVYATDIKDGNLPWTSVCGRTRTIRVGTDDIRWLSEKSGEPVPPALEVEIDNYDIRTLQKEQEAEQTTGASH